MGLSQVKARILRVKLHKKLTSIISVAFNKGAKGKGKITSINSVKGGGGGSLFDNS